MQNAYNFEFEGLARPIRENHFLWVLIDLDKIN